MRLMKQAALLTTVALASMAVAATGASAGMVEGPIEGVQSWEDLRGNGPDLGCGYSPAYFTGEVTDGTSNPATGTIDTWDACGEASWCTVKQDALPYEFEAYDDGTFKIMGIERDCIIAGISTTITAPVIEGQWGCGPGYVLPAGLFDVPSGGSISWEALWEVEGLQSTEPSCQ